MSRDGGVERGKEEEGKGEMVDGSSGQQTKKKERKERGDGGPESEDKNEEERESERLMMAMAMAEWPVWERRIRMVRYAAPRKPPWTWMPFKLRYSVVSCKYYALCQMEDFLRRVSIPVPGYHLCTRPSKGYLAVWQVDGRYRHLRQ